MLVAFCLWEWRNRHPMLDLRLFQNPRFAVSSGGITLVFFAMFGTFFLLAQYLQGVLDYSPLGAAVRLLPISVVMMAVAPQTPKLVARFGADKVGMAGLLFVAAGLVGIALVPDRHAATSQLVITMCVLAAGMALTMTPMTTQLMAAVPRDRAGMGSATNDTTRELGGALGVAVLGSLVASQYTSGVSDGRRRPARRGPGRRRGQPRRRPRPRRPGRRAGRRPSSTWPRSAFVDGLTLAATVGAVIVVIAARSPSSATCRRTAPTRRSPASPSRPPVGVD